MKFDVVIYHGGCADGTVGAWVFWRMNKKIRQYSYRYDTPPPKNLKGKRVVIVDYTFPRATLEKLKKITESLVVLDHHKSSKRELENLNYCYFDVERSGSQLAWDYVHAGVNPLTHTVRTCESRPWFIEVVSDRDLWKWEIPDSKAVTKGLFHSGQYTFDNIEKLYRGNEKALRSFYREIGQKIINEEEAIIQKACSEAELTNFTTPSGKVYRVKLVKYHHNLRSEIGNALAGDGCDFSAMWRYNPPSGDWWISLRGTRKNDIDVSLIANEFTNAGGHDKAAGFTIGGGKDLSDFFTKIEIN